MCGIGGLIGSSFDGRQRLLQKLSDRIAHRGPDDQGTWSDDCAALVHRRLSILDLSPAGHQPMISRCGRYVLVYNGELYNYIELREALQKRGWMFRGQSDSEVLIAAYCEYGPKCVQQFNGMWAFAIWDKYERSLFASRDRFGKKPFYFVEHRGGMIFASEIKALLATKLVSASPNPIAVADFGAERVSDHTEATFFQDVRQLTPASWLRWHDGRISQGLYWELPADNSEPITPRLLEEIATRLHDAVRLRLRADTPVGTLLSGGLDSSAVTCLAAEQSTAAIHAFSTIDRLPVEEAAGIDKVISAHGNVVLHRDEPSENCLTQELGACLWHQEEPFADGSMLAHFRLMRLAKECGVKVLLTGQGADEVFAGYPGYLGIHLAGLLANGGWGEARRFAKAVNSTGFRLSALDAIKYALPAGLLRHLRAARARRSIDWLADDYANVSAAVVSGYSRQPAMDPLNGALRESIRRRTLPGFLHYEDRNSMAFGVETRLPYLDYRLVEVVLPISGSFKLQGGLTKSLLRATVVGAVPSAIVNRVFKQGYPAPLATWLRSAEHQVVSDWLALAEACPLLRFNRWRLHYKTFMAGDDSELPAVWRGLILALWHQRFIQTSQ